MDEHSLMLVCVCVTLNFVMVRSQSHRDPCTLRTELQVNNCMETFLEAHQKHHDSKQIPVLDEFFSRQLCHQYERMLVCLHSFLSQCQTIHARHHVRHTLGSQWIQDVNKLCEIQIKSTKKEQQKEYDHLDKPKRNHRTKNTKISQLQMNDKKLQKINEELDRFHQLFLLHLKNKDYSQDIIEEVQFFRNTYSTNYPQNSDDDVPGSHKSNPNTPSDDENTRNNVENFISYKMSIENNYYSSAGNSAHCGYWEIHTLFTFVFLISLINIC